MKGAKGTGEGNERNFDEEPEARQVVRILVDKLLGRESDGSWS